MWPVECPRHWPIRLAAREDHLKEGWKLVPKVFSPSLLWGKIWGRSSFLYGWSPKYKGGKRAIERERKRLRRVPLLTKSGWHFFMTICDSLVMTDSVPYLSSARPQYPWLQAKASDHSTLFCHKCSSLSREGWPFGDFWYWLHQQPRGSLHLGVQRKQVTLVFRSFHFCVSST